MTRSKSKPVSLDGIKHAMGPGHIETRACKDKGRRDYHIKDIQKMDAVSVEMNHCTAFMGENEALQLVVSLAKAGHTQWGDDWLAQVERWLEGIR